MDEQYLLDLETKANRYDRIVRAQGRVTRAREAVARLRQDLRLALNEERCARDELVLAMTPIGKGVRG